MPAVDREPHYRSRPLASLPTADRAPIVPVPAFPSKAPRTRWSGAPGGTVAAKQGRFGNPFPPGRLFSSAARAIGDGESGRPA